MNLIILSDQNFFRLLLPVMTELNIASQVVLVNNLKELSLISDELKNESRLLSIFSAEIVPVAKLKKFGFGCYNLHPGSNLYPGWRAWSFAIMNNSDHFGLTLHEMSERVDEGSIIHMQKIPRDSKSTEQDFFSNVGKYVFEFFHSFPDFFLDHEKLIASDLNWIGGKFRKKDVQDIIKVDQGININLLITVIRAFGFGYLGEKPFLFKHNKKYILGPSYAGAYSVSDRITVHGFNFWSEGFLLQDRKLL
jgi:hypothetical protein